MGAPRQYARLRIGSKLGDFVVAALLPTYRNRNDERVLAACAKCKGWRETTAFNLRRASTCGRGCKSTL